MEPIAIFTSRADLPADAVNISAASRRTAADKLMRMISKHTGWLFTTSFLEYVVPYAFKRYQPAAGTAVEPGLTRGRLYCYLTQAELEKLFDDINVACDYDSELDELD
mgnify:CR=1 FL=1